LFTPEKIKDFNELLDEIVPVDFFESHTNKSISATIRQLKCFDTRIERYYANPVKDREKMEQLKPHLASYRELHQKRDELSDEATELLEQYRILIGEYRISLFSPEIKTTLSISAKKLKKFRQELMAKS
jgi:ATP-dependent helicase HrpA